jgi:hypothetical protein
VRIAGLHPPQETVGHEQGEQLDRPPRGRAQVVRQTEAVDQRVGIADRLGQFLLPRRQARKGFGWEFDDGLQTSGREAGSAFPARNRYVILAVSR